MRFVVCARGIKIGIYNDSKNTFHEASRRRRHLLVVEVDMETSSMSSIGERAVTTRITTELRHVDRLHKRFAHYYDKVESVKAPANKKRQPFGGCWS